MLYKSYIFIFTLQLFDHTLSRRLYSPKPHYETNKMCKDCKHFIANNECTKFYTNLETGEKTYDSLQVARGDENKCELATSFEPFHYKIRIPYYLLKCWVIVFIPVITVWINILYLFRN